MEVKIFTPSITIVLNELYIEFFKQVCKVELINTKQGHKDKGFGLCISKCSLSSEAFFFSCHSLASLIIMGDEFLILKIMYMY